ncbi:MAG: hypothetical protein J6T08_04715, partial [Lentisphaeria bacterium]|nr:hypothetical protein [Lentisphaeria bacterium]
MRQGILPQFRFQYSLAASPVEHFRKGTQGIKVPVGKGRSRSGPGVTEQFADFIIGDQSDILNAAISFQFCIFPARIAETVQYPVGIVLS